MLTLILAASRLKDEENPIALIDGFPGGGFTKRTIELVDKIVCIDSDTLEAWT